MVNVIVEKEIGLRKHLGMNNYQDATRKEILESVKLCCIECGGKMHVMQFNHLRYDETLIGYCCEDCPHYNLLDDNPV